MRGFQLRSLTLSAFRCERSSSTVGLPAAHESIPFRLVLCLSREWRCVRYPDAVLRPHVVAVLLIKFPVGALGMVIGAGYVAASIPRRCSIAALVVVARLPFALLPR